VAYYLGDAAAKAIGTYGLIAAGGSIILAGLGYLIVRRIESRVLAEPPIAERERSETPGDD
jgi:hypothetical protein